MFGCRLAVFVPAALLLFNCAIAANDGQPGVRHLQQHATAIAGRHLSQTTTTVAFPGGGVGVVVPPGPATPGPSYPPSPVPTTIVRFPGGGVNVGSGRRLSQTTTTVAFPGGGVGVVVPPGPSTPGPSYPPSPVPTTIVRFPGGGVNVGGGRRLSQTGTTVAFPGGGVGVVVPPASSTPGPSYPPSPAPTTVVSFPGGGVNVAGSSVDVRAGRLLSQATPAAPTYPPPRPATPPAAGGNPPAPAPKPSPPLAIAVFPGGGVNVDPTGQVIVGFPGGGVLVQPRPMYGGPGQGR